MTTAVQALDRVLLWGHYMIPQYYAPYDRIVHSHHLIKPDSAQLYHNDVDSWWYDAEATPVPNQHSSSSTEQASSTHWLRYLLLASILGLVSIWRYRRISKSSSQGN